MSFGEISTPPTVFFNYQTWGMRSSALVKPLSPATIQALTEVAAKLGDLSGYRLAQVGAVEHYQGEKLKSAPVGLLRFTKTGGPDLQGEHISLTVDLNTHALMGCTRMDGHVAGVKAEDVSHELALKQTVEFLKLNAPDLVSPDAILPVLPKANFVGSKLDFEEHPLRLGKIEIHWIGDHMEDFNVEKERAEFHGMKVKMYVPETQLWAWAIVDKQGTVNTFERNISWDFEKFERETQMWLHNKWLVERNKNGINLLAPTGESSPEPRL